ncbi:MFS transporter [Halalkalibacter lacteus]|uniref:MFS transporter n=1 Tax=Halalkalibacter lacteus TaxID=3090663 RepID=UPI002FCC95EF
MFAGFGIFFSGPGQTYSNFVYIDQYIEHFGRSRSEISGIYSIATFCAGILIMFVGRLVDKIGKKKMMAIDFFLIRLFGQGSMTLVPNTLVP